MGSMGVCDASKVFSASFVKKTPGGWGGYKENKANNTSFKQFRETLWFPFQRKRDFNENGFKI